MNDQKCDVIEGNCSPTPLNKSSLQNQPDNKVEIIYIGDPMCSWCYGIAPELKKLQAHYKKEGISLKIVMGGLRPGGGDEWTNEFKTFLKHHWEEVQEKSSQPFGFKLFEHPNFNYDTEPSCRAIVAARIWLNENELAFFEAIQTNFYLHSQDPSTKEFYKPLCIQFGIDFDQFIIRFESDIIKKETYNEFLLNRKWGVTGYPSILLNINGKQSFVTKGYATAHQMITTINHLLGTQK